MMTPNQKKATGWLAVCVAITGASEGLRQTVYLDVIGVPTYCYGETKDPKWGTAYTKDQCDEKLSLRLQEFDLGVDKCVEHDLPDNRRAAYVSFAYNVGVPAFCNSTLVKLENTGDWRGACNQLPRWNKAGGIPWPGLTTRREREKLLCLGEEPWQ